MNVIQSAPDLLNGLPRGLTNKYLKDQSIPQARWQDQADIEAVAELAYDPENPDGKILLGAIGEKLIGIKDNRHVQTCAGNRSGKSVSVIANLLHYNGSVMMIDPKAEGANKTAQRRAALGQDVFVLDPCGRAKGKAKKYRGHYNPLMTLSLESESVIEEAMQIIDALIVKSGAESDPHWNDSAAEALLGFILYARFGSDVPKSEQNLVTVRRFVKKALRKEQIDEETVGFMLPRRIMAGIKYLRGTENEDIAEAIEDGVRGLYEKPHDEMGSVLSTMNRHTAFLNFRSMRKILSGHDFKLRDLKRKKITVYLCLPANRMGRCNRWLRLLVNQLIDAMEAETTVPDAPVLAILDEFPVLGKMQALEDAAGQIASYHLKLWTIIQDWGQGKAIYGERWESFAANCGINQWFANIDLTTTEYISKRLGKTPVISTRQGEASRDQLEKGLSGKSQSRELYDLLTPDEVARTFARSDPMKRQLIMLAGLHPMILQRVEYWNEDAPYHHHFAGKYEGVH